MTITSEIKVGQLAATHPLATRVFARHGIDYCCGGGAPLAEVCSRKGLDTAAVMAEIEEELAAPGADGKQWDKTPLPELIDHILAVYHASLKEELPRLDGMAHKVLDVHGDKDPARFAALVEVFTGLRAELQQHMLKEEQILFPMIRRGQGTAAGAPVGVMMHEHEVAGEALRRLRTLTDDYTVPQEACNTWRALWHGLAALEAALHEHIHLENNILFPRALAGPAGELG